MLHQKTLSTQAAVVAEIAIVWNDCEQPLIVLQEYINKRVFADCTQLCKTRPNGQERNLEEDLCGVQHFEMCTTPIVDSVSFPSQIQ